MVKSNRVAQILLGTYLASAALSGSALAFEGGASGEEGSVAGDPSGACMTESYFGKETPWDIRWEGWRRGLTNFRTEQLSLSACRRYAQDRANSEAGIYDSSKDTVYFIESATMRFESEDGKMAIKEEFLRDKN